MHEVGGSTTLLDAIGRTIHKISNAQKNTSEEYLAEKVMFVIITDGEEKRKVRLGIYIPRCQYRRGTDSR